MSNLIIVESPTKAKTISQFLDKTYTLTSSYGHIRDLPKSKMGIEIENDFKPQYVVPLKAKKAVESLKALAKKSKEIYFATDEDREGEAIAWHLSFLLKTPEEKIKRIVFHEITKNAILEALKNPRKIDQNLVNAQQARRILDRLVGYELSPFLWKKVTKGLSAGRVQSVTVRLVVEKEREIEAFKIKEYWTIDAIFKKDNQTFEAQLAKIDRHALSKFGIENKEAAEAILKELEKKDYQITSVKKKEHKKQPLPPFTTSTLQQEANKKLGYSSKKTMMFAQQLYEGINIGQEGQAGLITYMRTDSVNLAQKFLDESKNYIISELGEKYYPGFARKFKGKQKLAQEAHEAIRPTEVTHDPESIRQYLNNEQYRLYKLIWQRAVACQMQEALFDQTAVEIESDDKKYIFNSGGLALKFDGFLKIYPNTSKEEILPNLEEGDKVEKEKISPSQHFTQPPARYSEATLVKKLEELGIGRPSTYAPTLSTIQDRNYVIKEEGRFKPTEIGTLVNDLLVKHFEKIVDFQFTAQMENELDEIADGKIEWVPVIKEFYGPFKENLTKKEVEISKKDLTESESSEVCDKCGAKMIIKMGRFGKFLACSAYPDCKSTKPLDGESGQAEVVDKNCPKCGAKLVIKRGRFGKFLGCSSYPDCKYIEKTDNKTGVKCPQCEKGDIVKRRGKSGRTFYGCNGYPDCKFILWNLPTGEKCPDCGSLLVFKNKKIIACSKADCQFKKDQ